MSNYLDSLSLSPEAQTKIEAAAAAIRQNNRTSLRLRIENGQHCREIKALIGHGDWLDWLVGEANVGYRSVRTVERDMALAERLYQRLDEVDEVEDMTSVTALFELCRAGAHEDALETALHLVGEGQQVTPRQADHLTTIYAVNEQLGQKVRDGDLTITDALGVAQRLDELQPAPEVVALVVESGVRSGGMVDALNVLQTEQPERFEEVVASGTIYNPVAELEVPLSEASAADGFTLVETEGVEREARRQAHIRGWREKQPERVGVAKGTREALLEQLAALLPNDGRAYRVYVYPDTVEIEVVGV